MDERIARQLREANDPVSITEVCGLMRRDPSYHAQIRTLLQPLVRQCGEAREVFLAVLPPGSNAFCIRCREPFELDEDGFPKGRRASVPRKKRKLCASCEGLRSQQMAVIQGNRAHWVTQQYHDVIAKAFDQMLYCGRCGAVGRPGHNCGQRPAWITGGDPGDNPPPAGDSPWVKWRDA
jgi:hypothetical protein